LQQPAQKNVFSFYNEFCVTASENKK